MAVVAKSDAVDFVDAGRGKRFLNLMLDNAVISGLLAPNIEFLFERAELQDLTGIVFVITFGYYAGFEATLGRTPAKFLTGTKVVGESGGRPSVAQILGRTLARWFPFEPLSFFGRGRGWHDRWSGTRVISTRVDVQPESARPSDWETDPHDAAGRVRVVVNAPAEAETGRAPTYRGLDPATRRVVCGVCNEEFKFGRSSCPRCEAEYRYVAGRPELRQD